MESIRSRAPVEQTVNWRGCAVLVGLALFAQGAAQAHGLNFLLAKVTPGVGVMQVEITADFADNPMIETAEQAQEVIQKMLVLNTPEGIVPVGQHGGFSFRRTEQVDPSCPFQFPADATALPHQFITGTTTEIATTPTATFSVPQGNPHDVILWTDPSYEGTAQKYFLIAGDTTDPIAISQPNAPPKFPMVVLGILTVGYVVLRWWLIFRRRSASRPKPG